MRNVLPVHYPLFQHVPANAYLLSIIGDKPDEYSWIMNNFVNIRYNLYTRYDDFYRNDMWYNCYHITENRFTKEFLDLFSNEPFELLKTMIDAGYYIYMFLNRRYIKNYKRPENGRHNPMIYGYDTDKNEVYIADFFRGRSFKFEVCSIDEFNLSYPYVTGEEDFYKYVWNRALKKKEGYQYEFNLKDLIVKLDDYRKSTDMSASRYYAFDNNDVEEVLYDKVDGGYDYIYGLNVYDAVKEHLELGKLKNRPLHLLYETKRLMCMRIEFLWRNDYLTVEDFRRLNSKCVKLRDELLKIRNLVIKARLTEQLTLNMRLEFSKYLKAIKEEDREFTEDLITALNGR